VFGTAAEYRVSEVADRNAGIVLKISKERLRTLTLPPAPATEITPLAQLGVQPVPNSANDSAASDCLARAIALVVLGSFGPVVARPETRAAGRGSAGSSRTTGRSMRWTTSRQLITRITSRTLRNLRIAVKRDRTCDYTRGPSADLRREMRRKTRRDKGAQRRRLPDT